MVVTGDGELGRRHDGAPATEDEGQLTNRAPRECTPQRADLHGTDRSRSAGVRGAALAPEGRGVAPDATTRLMRVARSLGVRAGAFSIALLGQAVTSPRCTQRRATRRQSTRIAPTVRCTQPRTKRRAGYIDDSGRCGCHHADAARTRARLHWDARPRRGGGLEAKQELGEHAPTPSAVPTPVLAPTGQAQGRGAPTARPGCNVVTARAPNHWPRPHARRVALPLTASGCRARHAAQATARPPHGSARVHRDGHALVRRVRAMTSPTLPRLPAADARWCFDLLAMRC
ncbi:hypothetical protein HPP92_014356 [Vanilla planifolia]|uniref:Uncharacterized protein n=1 Tax=Vanilla planifolia TaxID=51239 RepID=A0A835UW53_VANPL|nr:hypothetical protein HPP92_014356 [Vanilla planifolia]